jgi:hypothetical protein
VDSLFAYGSFFRINRSTAGATKSASSARTARIEAKIRGTDGMEEAHTRRVAVGEQKTNLVRSSWKDANFAILFSATVLASRNRSEEPKVRPQLLASTNVTLSGKVGIAFDILWS